MGRGRGKNSVDFCCAAPGMLALVAVAVMTEAEQLKYNLRLEINRLISGSCTCWSTRVKFLCSLHVGSSSNDFINCYHCCVRLMFTVKSPKQVILSACNI